MLATTMSGKQMNLQCTGSRMTWYIFFFQTFLFSCQKAYIGKLNKEKVLAATYSLNLIEGIFG